MRRIREECIPKTGWRQDGDGNTRSGGKPAASLVDNPAAYTVRPPAIHSQIDRTHLIAWPDFDDSRLSHIRDSRVIGRLVLFSHFIGTVAACGCEADRTLRRAGVQVVPARGYPIEAVLAPIIRSGRTEHVENSLPVFVVGFSKEFNRDGDGWISSRVGDAPVDAACRRQENRKVRQ